MYMHVWWGAIYVHIMYEGLGFITYSRFFSKSKIRLRNNSNELYLRTGVQLGVYLQRCIVSNFIYYLIRLFVGHLRCLLGLCAVAEIVKDIAQNQEARCLEGDARKTTKDTAKDSQKCDLSNGMYPFVIPRHIAEIIASQKTQ